MTACNVLSTPAKAWIYTDSLISNAETRIPLAFTSKVWTAPHARMTVSGRGRIEAVMSAAPLVISSFGSVDDAKDGIAAKLTEFFAAHPEWIAPMPLEQAIVGWSPKRNAMALFVCDSASGFAPRETTIVVGPEISLDEMEAEGVAVHNGAIQFNDVRRDMIGIAHAQRRRGSEGIGGHVVETTLTRDAIEQRVVYTWQDDRVGEPIDASATDWLRQAQAMADLRASRDAIAAQGART